MARDPLAAAHPGARRVAAGPSPDGVLADLVAYEAHGGWHLLTDGLAAAGFGHELTLITPPAPEPPDWALGLLLATARTCVAVGRPLHAGARLAPGAPIDGSGLVAVAVREDPVVPRAGELLLLQAVGITEVEHRLMGRAGTLPVLEALARRDPLLRTDPARAAPGPSDRP